MNIVILCGGSGTRLWPLSRKKLPKQFLDLVNDKTMFQNTLLRFKTLEVSSLNFIIICNKEHDFIVKQQIDEILTQFDFSYNIVTEPIGRDTSAAICISSLLTNPDEISLVVPCDHIFNDEHFCNLVNVAEEYYINTKENAIVTFGIKPNCPETGYGYIQFGEGNVTEQFVEKPTKDLAEKYIQQGNYVWNAGVFMFINKVMINCFETYSSDILQVCRETLNNSEEKGGILHLNKECFETCKANSIDYEIMEKVTNSKVFNPYTLEYSSKWSDIGSFKVLSEECEKDNNGNNIKGDVVVEDTENCYINTEHSVVTTIGVKNLVIVNQRDSLLVCDKDSSQDVKKVLKGIDSSLKEVHSKAYRPWGWYTCLEGSDTSGFKVKRICVYPGKRLSLQTHNHRSEHWVITKGNAKVQLNEDFFEMSVNDHIYINVKALHRLCNETEENVELIETQIGEYLGEDDIIRYSDDFGRV